MTTSKNYEQSALEYAEKYGIIDYTVKGNKMTYYETYPNEGTFKAVVNLKTMVEVRTHLKRRYKKHCR